MEALRERFERGAVVAGVLSGTSADGIDVAITRIRCEARTLRPPECLAFSLAPYPEELGRRVRAVLDADAADRGFGPRECALLSRDLGREFGRAARTAAARAGVSLDLVASHGQTVWHHDGREESGPATSQLGDGDFVAEEAGCAVASDFRQRDVAAGGEGAPLSALADGLIFERVRRPAAILNLGGMANLTVLGEREEDLLAFDTGPAGSLLDGLVRRLYGEPFDRDGERASAGVARADLVRAWLEHPFFRRSPPKSTGRDTFGERYVSAVVDAAPGARPEDLVASAVDFVAATVAEALERFVGPLERLFVAGGGARNPALLAALARRIPGAVATTAEAGVDPKAREALVFAVLGARCALGIPSTHPGATGARAGLVLGKLSLS